MNKEREKKIYIKRHRILNKVSNADAYEKIA
jgi:hypothetical protein